MALEAAIPARKAGEKIFLLLDNQAAVRALRTGTSSSSLKEIRDFYDIACKTNAEVRWVPGHSKIEGDEEVDTLARGALQLPPLCSDYGTASIIMLLTF
jgi:ribonuclease HI